MPMRISFVTRLLLLGISTSQSVFAHLRHHRKLLKATDEANKLPEQFVLVFDDSVTDVPTKVESLTANIPECSVLYTYQQGIKGVAVSGLSDSSLWQILEDPEVTLAEEDQVLKTNEIQQDATWGLDRIDQRNLPLDDSYEYGLTGKGVRVFIMDTGVRTTHIDFSGRASCGFSVFDDGCRDGQGHGTHVAGTVASNTFGVAKDAQIVGVKVLNSRGEGSVSAALAAVQYIRGEKENNAATPMVANLSLGGITSSILDVAVNRAAEAGIIFVVAAGNSNDDACFYSPARASNVITVAATNWRDGKSYFSSFGSCVNVWAPGQSISSLWPTNDRTYTSLSGSSMAAPHVAGAAALYLEANPDMNAKQVWEAIERDAVRGVVENVGDGSPNLLLNVERVSSLPGNGAAPVTAPVTAPVLQPTPAPQPPQPEPSRCSFLFDDCANSSDCCSDSCRFNICWFW